MQRRYLYLTCFLLLCLGLVIGLAGGVYLPFNRSEQYMPPLRVTGDVEKALTLRNREGFEKVEIEYKGEDYQVLRLGDLLKQAAPLTEEYGLVLAGSDGLSALLDGERLADCYLNFSSSNGWEAVNLRHPVSSNIKHLNQIIVHAAGSPPERALRIISPEENIKTVTAGQLLKDGVKILPYFEGSSSLKNAGRDYQISIYTRKRVVYLEELTGRSVEERSLIIGAGGETAVFNGGYLEINANLIDYFDPESDSRIEDVRGVVLDALVLGNRDAYHDALHYLEQGRRVLVFLLDGFGFHQYREAVENGSAPFLKGIQPAGKAMTVFKPVTNAGLAAVLTGTGPAENGVYSRKQKELHSEDIFKKAGELGETAAYVEGNIKILNTSLEPRLNPDQNGNGTTDDEVFSTALEAVREGYSLVFVHFHGIDDAGHRYGDLAPETMEVIKSNDDYVRRLVSEWPGKVIITSDHGMHREGGGGDHGLVYYQDLFVPYIITDGGESD